MMENASYARFENNPARQLAYRIWANNSSAPITELMPEIEAAVGEKVALRTVQGWRHRDKWDDRLAWELLAKSERIVIEHVIGARVAAPEAIAYLRSVVAGEVLGTPERISAAKALVAENRARMLAMVGKLVQPEMTENVALSEAELLALEPKWEPGS